MTASRIRLDSGCPEVHKGLAEPESVDPMEAANLCRLAWLDQHLNEERAAVWQGHSWWPTNEGWPGCVHARALVAIDEAAKDA